MNDTQEATTKQMGQWESLTDWVRARTGAVLNPAADFLAGLGVRPNAITLVGFLLQVGVATLFALDQVRWGGGVLFIVAPMDALDGAVARASGTDGPFGAFLDSTLDRLSDAALILGLTAHSLQRGALLEVGLFLSALVAALMVSYTRARAEALNFSCRVGLLTRLERILLVAALSALGLVTPLAWALSILSIVTVVQRVVHVYRASSWVE